jgi:hypothetical protein
MIVGSVYHVTECPGKVCLFWTGELQGLCFAILFVKFVFSCYHGMEGADEAVFVSLKVDKELGFFLLGCISVVGSAQAKSENKIVSDIISGLRQAEM